MNAGPAAHNSGCRTFLCSPPLISRECKMFRGAMYAGALGAAAYAAPYAYGYGRPACGYYPYPPCY